MKTVLGLSIYLCIYVNQVDGVTKRNNSLVGRNSAVFIIGKYKHNNFLSVQNLPHTTPFHDKSENFKSES